MRTFVALSYIFLFAALFILADALSQQNHVVKDQRIYIEAGCNGRYQGEE